MSVNRLTLIGNLGKDPAVRYTQSGSPVCNFSIATSRIWTDRNKDRQEETTWHNVTVWGRDAENCGKYLAKGKKAYVEGRVKTRSWDKPDGTRVEGYEVVADRVLFLSPMGDRIEGAAEGEESEGPGYAGAPVLDEDSIPF